MTGLLHSAKLVVPPLPHVLRGLCVGLTGDVVESRGPPNFWGKASRNVWSVSATSGSLFSASFFVPLGPPPHNPFAKDTTATREETVCGTRLWHTRRGYRQGCEVVGVGGLPGGCSSPCVLLGFPLHTDPLHNVFCF